MQANWKDTDLSSFKNNIFIFEPVLIQHMELLYVIINATVVGGKLHLICNRVYLCPTLDLPREASGIACYLDTWVLLTAA